MAGRVLPENGMVGGDVKFDRIRRITGYLVGTTDRFNNAKRAEERDRVKPGLFRILSWMAPASDLSSSPRDVLITVPDAIIPRLTTLQGDMR